jgi:hypothetical protein
MTVWWLSLKTT